MSGADPFGMLMWFDPATEVPMIRAREPSEEAGVPVVMRGDDTSDLTRYQIEIFPKGSPS